MATRTFIPVGSPTTKLEQTLVDQHGSLVTHFPELVKYWHPTKNEGIEPSQITKGSTRLAWWICPNGHEYITAVMNRTTAFKNSSGRAIGCPQCSKQNASKIRVKDLIGKKGSLAQTHPEIISEWHPTKNKTSPEKVLAGSHELITWVCKRGHEWKAQVKNRALRGDGCPECNNNSTSRLEIAIYTELSNLFDGVLWRSKVLGKELDIYLPQFQVGIEVDGSYWHKNKQEKDNSKTKFFKENNINVIRLRSSKLNKLSETDILINDNVEHFISCKLVLERLIELSLLNKCELDKVKEYLAGGILKNSSAYKKILARLPGPDEADSLAAKNPEAAKLWDYQKNFPLQPTMFLATSAFKAWWKCDKGHEFQQPIINLNKSSLTIGNGCKKCWYENMSKHLAKKRGSIAELRPDLLKEWNYEKNNPLNPEDITLKSTINAWWKCDKGHEWFGRVRQRVEAKYGCMVCSRLKKAVPKNSNKTLASLYPNVSKL
jgi:very-short-patch-repair endonuclease